MALPPRTSPPIFDGHNDTVLSLVKTGRSFFGRATEGHIDLPRAREGGLGGGFFAVYIHDPVTAGDAAGAPVEASMRIYDDERTWPEPPQIGHFSVEDSSTDVRMRWRDISSRPK